MSPLEINDAAEWQIAAKTGQLRDYLIEIEARVLAAF
jgi:hypothetical protein